MAEIRKFKPTTGAIAEALAAAMGEPIRPVTPGSRPIGAEEADSRSEAEGPAALSRTAGWQGFTVHAAPVVGDAGRPDGGSEETQEGETGV